MKDKQQTKSPAIGISATLLPIECGHFLGRERSAVGHDYIQAIQLVGGVPLVLPIITEHSLIQQQIELVDGLLLSGGYDVCPLQYGEEPQRELEAICPQRDLYEMELVKRALHLGKPIFGICRGLQLLNVAFGGTLYQDIHFSLPDALQHNSKAKPEEETHCVSLLSGTKLREIMGESTLLTNSFHHQSIKNLAPHLIVNALTQDHVIEGIESKDHPFVLGVQWHPELMFNRHPHMLKLFQAFVEAARKARVT